MTETQIHEHGIAINFFQNDDGEPIGIVAPNKSHRSELLGKKIRRLAEQHNMTVKTVALLLGSNEEYVVSLYNGKAFLSYPRFQILARSLGMDVIELLTVDESEDANATD